MNLLVPRILFGLLFLAAIYLAATRSAFCILRKKEIPPDSAQTIRRILSAAFFVIYLFVGLIAYLALALPTAEAIYALLSQETFVPSVSAVPTGEVPQRKMAAEQDHTERQQVIAAITEQQIKAIVERRLLFGQEQSYVLLEGISGTEDRYLSPKPEAEQLAAPSATPPAETRISVQEIVASSEGIASILPAQNSQAAQIPVPPPTPQTIPVQQQQQLPIPATPPSAPELVPENRSSLPSTVQQQPVAMPEMPIQQVPAKPVQQFSPAPSPIQTQPAAQNVACAEIKRYMDGADLQIFHRAMSQATGVATPWKGPGGAYIVVPASIKGNCREYSIQANIQGKSLRCYAMCASIAPPAPPAKRTIPAQQNDKTAILSSMNRNDQDALRKALTYYGPVSWRSLSGIFYTVSPVRLGNPCREYTVQANIQGRVFQYLASNCQ